MLNDHIHILIEILPKYSVAQVIGYIREKVHCIEQGGMENDKGTLPGSICGHEGILFRRWDLIRKIYLQTMPFTHNL